MNYNSDRPIENEGQDLLERSYFSNQLGQAIYEYNISDGLVIGLFGKWGTGKTSVINMALDKVNRLAVDDDNKPLIIKFAPWNYSSKDDLIRLYFHSLKYKINIQGNDALKKKVGKALSDYSEAFDSLSAIPIVGTSVAPVLKAVAKAQGTKLKMDTDLDQTRETLEKSLIEANKKIIVVIDDIDRLNQTQIRDIFQLVKQVADFPNVIYLLAMDRNIVSRALSDIYNIDGNEYLEKIIQIPFEIPELRKSKLHNIFFSKIDKIFNDLSVELILDENYWSSIFQNCIDPYINTLRDVNRVINTFQFKFATLRNETSFEDLLGLTTLEVMEPELYRWISHNKDAVCGSVLHGLMSSGADKPDYRQIYYDEFKQLGINSPDMAIKSLSTMFPTFAKDVKEYRYYGMTMNVKSKMRVADEGRFNLYFMIDFSDIKVSRNVVTSCICNLDNETLCNVIKEINNEGNIIFLIEEIRSLIDEIPYERLGLIASEFIKLSGEFHGETSRAMFTLSAWDISEFLILDIIKRLRSEEEKFLIIRSVLDSIDKYGLGMIASIINRIERSYGRITSNSLNLDDQLISVAHLEIIEEEYVDKIKRLVESEPIWDANMFYHAFYLWECFDSEGITNYLNKIFKDDCNKLKFLCGIAGKWHGTNGSGWNFDASCFSKYFSQDEIYNIIQSIEKNKLKDFSKIELIKLASFALNYQKDEMHHANENEAMILVDEWITSRNNV